MEESLESDYSGDVDEVPSPHKRKSNDEHPKQASKKFKKELYRQPTTEELNQMRETENLFNSNLFRLQLKELLSEIQVKEKYKNQFQLWYDKFTRFLKKLPQYDEVNVSEIHKRKKLRKPDFECDQDVNLHFLRPTSCKIVGLHALNAAVGSTLTVDVNIEMSKKCLYEKDGLNNRYLVKRYYYLLYVAEEIEKANICSKISLCHFIDFNAVPVLKIQPGTSNHIIIKLSAVPPEDYFRDNRFLPNKNNLKMGFNQKNTIIDEDLAKSGTSHYNSMLLQNIRSNKNNTFIHNMLQDFQSAREGLQLLIVWLKQRQLYDVLGISDEFLVQLLAYLLNERYINKHTSSYQIVRSVWLFISKSDWQNEPISICKDVKSDTFSLFKEYFDVIFLDSSGCYNITSFLILDVYSKLKHEAKMAVQYLDGNVTNNSFDCLFIKNLPFILQYDTVLKLKNVKAYAREKKLSERKDKLLFLQNFSMFAAVRAVLNKLKSGLNKRAFFMVPHFVQNEICYELNDDSKLTSSDVLVGISLVLDGAFNVLELGPTPHDPKVKDFLSLWGELSALRRFPDGTTCETVYFETKTVKAKREIVRKIIDLIAREKLKLNYELLFDQFEEVLISKKFIAPFPNGTNEEICLKIISIGDELNNILRTLKLPLEITSILGNADAFNYTELFPPIPASYDWKKIAVKSKENSMILQEDSVLLPYYIAPIRHVIQLSLNSKWPNDLEATRHVKTAFLLKISELLQSFSIKTNLTLEHLDVFYKGLVFRYSIFHPKEISLVKRIVNEQGVVSYKESKESAALERELDIGPKVCSALKGIHSQYPSFGPSTALAKRWLRSHLLDDFYISDTVINLINASLYLNSAPFSTPVVPQIGFLRFLKFLFEADWSVQMVIVNFNEELDRQTIGEIEMNFYQHRENYPNLFVLMPYDNCKSVYTKTSPTKEVLKRISVLAKHCYETFSSSLSTGSLTDIKSFFKPSLEGFNVIIRLKLTQNTRFYQNINYKHSKEVVLDNHDEERNKLIPVTDFNPVDLYLRELRQNYGKFALFFHDSYGGNIIGVLWKPHALEVLDFKVSQISGKKVHNNKLITNFDAIVDDFHILGQGIVKKIERK